MIFDSSENTPVLYIAQCIFIGMAAADHLCVLVHG